MSDLMLMLQHTIVNSSSDIIFAGNFIRGTNINVDQG